MIMKGGRIGWTIHAELLEVMRDVCFYTYV
jgi:hypothetical protein